MAQAPDIFRNQVDIGGGFSLDAALITFANTPELGRTGYLAQNLNITYGQQITRVYELGSNKTYFMRGRTQGNLAIGRIAGPRAASTTFLDKYADMCQMEGNTVTITEVHGCSSVGTVPGLRLQLDGVIITNVGYAVAANDMIFRENIQAMFVRLNVTAGGVPGNPVLGEVPGAPNVA